MQGAGAGTGSGHECSYTVATREVDDTCSVSSCLPLWESCGKWLLSAAPPGGRRCAQRRRQARGTRRLSLPCPWSLRRYGHRS
nr:hypothetical protein [uncultured bacterium]